MILINRPSIVNVNILYYMPDYINVLQTFYWQTEDLWPDIPRVHCFLNFWKEQIIAPINTVDVQLSGSNWRSINSLKDI